MSLEEVSPPTANLLSAYRDDTALFMLYVHCSTDTVEARAAQSAYYTRMQWESGLGVGDFTRSLHDLRAEIRASEDWRNLTTKQ